MSSRCLLCGREFEIESLEEKVKREEEEDELFAPPVKTTSVCPRCQAKLRHEAEEAQKIPKPV